MKRKNRNARAHTQVVCASDVHIARAHNTSAKRTCISLIALLLKRSQSVSVTLPFCCWLPPSRALPLRMPPSSFCGHGPHRGCHTNVTKAIVTKGEWREKKLQISLKSREQLTGGYARASISTELRSYRHCPANTFPRRRRTDRRTWCTERRSDESGGCRRPEALCR